MRALSLSLSAFGVFYLFVFTLLGACTEREGHEQQLPHLVLRLLPDHCVCRPVVLLPLLGTGPLLPPPPFVYLLLHCFFIY